MKGKDTDAVPNAVASRILSAESSPALPPVDVMAQVGKSRYEDYVDSVARKSLYQRWKNTKDPEMKKLFGRFGAVASQLGIQEDEQEQHLNLFLGQKQEETAEVSKELAGIIAAVRENKEKIMKVQADPIDVAVPKPLPPDPAMLAPEDPADEKDSDSPILFDSPNIIPGKDAFPSEETSDRLRSLLVSDCSKRPQPERALLRAIELLFSALDPQKMKAELVLALGCDAAGVDALVKGKSELCRCGDSRELLRELLKTMSEDDSQQAEGRLQATLAISELNRRVAFPVGFVGDKVQRLTTNQWVQLSFTVPAGGSGKVAAPEELMKVSFLA